MAAGATYEPIATTTLGSAASSITFSSIPSTYTDLRLVITGTTSLAGIPINMQFNSDTATNYSITRLTGSGSAASSNSTTSASAAYIDDANGWDSTIPSTSTFDIFSYAGSTYKTTLTTSSEDTNGSGYVYRGVMLWRSTAAINTVTIKAQNGSFNFKTGTTATIWGIKAA